MALTVSPTFPPPPNSAPYAIGREWCMGDSLGIINANFNNFDTRLELLSGQINILRQPGQIYFYVNSETVPSVWRGTPVQPGNDATANGTTTSPFKTLAACLDHIYKSRDLNGVQFYICLAAGTYQGCTISGMPPGSGIISRPIQPNLQEAFINIAGDSELTTFITQLQITNTLWGTFYITNGAYVIFDQVTFRYNPNNPFIPTAQPGSGFNTNFDVITVSHQSNVTMFNCTFEAVEMALTTRNPQETLTRYFVVNVYSNLFSRNTTIKNVKFGTPGNPSVFGRYFMQAYRSVVTFGGYMRLQNSPRFSAFAEPSQGAHYVHQGSFQWEGSFGSQLGNQGGEGDFRDNYLPGQARNYLLKQDGPYNFCSLRNQVPTNAFRTAYSASHDNTVYNRIGYF